jgi:hypothetical protein
VSNETDIADGTLVVICWYEDGQLTALADDANENGEPDVYLYGPDVRELVEAGRDVHGPTVRAVSVPKFRKMAGEEVLEDFPKLARYRGTPGYASLLELAENLVDGGMRAEIDLDLEETPLDEPDAWAENGCAEYGALLDMDAGSWREDVHGGALWVEYEDEDELPPPYIYEDSTYHSPVWERSRAGLSVLGDAEGDRGQWQDARSWGADARERATLLVCPGACWLRSCRHVDLPWRWTARES